MQRQSSPPEPNQALNGYACTMEVEDYDSTEGKILHNGGTVALPKYALPGMAWQGYFRIPKVIYLAFINQMRMQNRMFLLGYDEGDGSCVTKRKNRPPCLDEINNLNYRTPERESPLLQLWDQSEVKSDVSSDTLMI